MKITHIVNCSRGGGILNFLVALTAEQVKKNHDVTIVIVEASDASTDEYARHKEEIMILNGVKVHHLDKKRKNKLSLLQTLSKCRKFIKGQAPQIVNTHGALSHIYGAVSTMKGNAVHCITIHSSPEKWDRLNMFLNKRKPLIFCSDAAHEAREQPNRNFTVISNGISPQITKSAATTDLRAELNLPEDARIVVLAGSLRPLKNYDFLKEITVALNDSNIHFCVCGGNYGEGYISTDSFEDFPTIHFMGLRSDISAIENGSDVFMSCSTIEGLPIAVLEAFFNGIPCVLSPIVPHKQIGEGIPACFIPEDFTAGSFVASLRQALDIKESHSRIYEMRTPHLLKYSISGTAEKYTEFYLKCRK